MINFQFDDDHGIKIMLDEDGMIRLYTDCCGCDTGITSEHFDQVVDAWLARRESEKP